MTQKRFILSALAATVILAAAVPYASGQGFTIRNDITVAAGETQDNVFTLGGNVVVDGRVKQSVIAVGGSITISGEVGEAVIGIGSRIIIKSTAVVGDDVVALGGTLEKEPGCTIRGTTYYIQSSEIGDRIFKQGPLKGFLSLSFTPIVIFIKLIVLCVWLVVALLGAAIFPKPVTFAAGEIRKSFWPIFGTGLLAVIVFTGLIIFAAILSIILIGIPILLALIAAGIILKTFGRLTIFTFVGDSALRAVGARRITPMGAVLAGFFVVSLISFVPILGFLAISFLNVVGWGAAIRTKFGTVENWFLKKPVA